MRPLVQALNDHDLIILRVIGEWWELDLTGADKSACVQALAEGLTSLDILQEVQYLGPEEGASMHDGRGFRTVRLCRFPFRQWRRCVGFWR